MAVSQTGNVESNGEVGAPALPPRPLMEPFYGERLSLPFVFRLPLASFAAFVGGGSLGIAQGGKMAGMRFRAEHAHVFPTTTTGWYFYHKSKNYHVMLGSIKEGLKMGAKISFWAGSFMLIEGAMDGLRGTKDVFSTTIAGLGVAGGFSAWNRFPVPTAARTCKTGLYGGLAYGILQDVIGLARGRRPGYMSFVLGGSREAIDFEATHDVP